MQQIPFIDLFKSALHDSGDKLAHPQEHFLTVHTAFGTKYRYCLNRCPNDARSHKTSSSLVFMERTRYSCQILMKSEFSIQKLEKYSRIKFHENPFSVSPAVACRPTDIKKLIVAFPNFAKSD